MRGLCEGVRGEKNKYTVTVRVKVTKPVSVKGNGYVKNL